jgi:hypothetical protein
MTEITDPLPQDPSGPSTVDQESTLVNGSQQLLDAGSTGTDEGPAGIPAALLGRDRAGDEVPPPPAALPDGQTGGTTSIGPAEDADPLSPADTASPLQESAGRGESTMGNPLPSGRDGVV